MLQGQHHSIAGTAAAAASWLVVGTTSRPLWQCKGCSSPTRKCAWCSCAAGRCSSCWCSCASAAGVLRKKCATGPACVLAVLVSRVCRNFGCDSSNAARYALVCGMLGARLVHACLTVDADSLTYTAGGLC
jgi:hypothetical protein